MNTKQKTILATVLSILFLPTAVLAEIGVGVTADSNGNSSLSIGIGSNGSGAGNIWGSSSSSGGGWTLSDPYGLPSGSILGIASNLLFWLLAIFAILGVVGFVIAGIIYLVSAGDETMITRAKDAMIYSIVGIIVGLSGFLIMQAVAAMLSGSRSTY
jgi:hypothetical protein